MVHQLFVLQIVWCCYSKQYFIKIRTYNCDAKSG